MLIFLVHKTMLIFLVHKTMLNFLVYKISLISSSIRLLLFLVYKFIYSCLIIHVETGQTSCVPTITFKYFFTECCLGPIIYMSSIILKMHQRTKKMVNLKKPLHLILPMRRLLKRLA